MSEALLLFVLGMSLPGLGRCYRPSDQTPGWKKVAVPADAPALAAPDDIDQLRGGESALLVDDAPDALQIESPAHWGRVSYSFRVDPQRTRFLEVAFVRDLQGAAVDVTGLRQGAAITLSQGHRGSGTSVAASWDEPFELLVITVHHHFRERPVVRLVQVGAREAPELGTAMGHAEIPRSYQAPGFLYFRHPGGRDVELCNREAFVPRFHRGYWDAAPTLVELRR